VTVTVSNYQALSQRTSQWQPGHPDYRKDPHRTYGEISLAGETGECVDSIKKAIFHDRKDDSKIVNECGDVCWSVACLCEVHELSFDEIAQSGIDGASDFGVEDNALDMFRYAAFVISASQCNKRFDLGRNLANVIACVTSVATYANATLEDVLTANVSKLAARYPTGSYRHEDSIARRDCEGTPTAPMRVVATVERGSISTVPGPVEGEG
jgi:NTP pyrophosphatase (non-canonical NTP hydrolase)